jgi:serine/threonine-protein kinase RsbW
MKTFNRQYPSEYASVPKARRDVAAFARQCGLGLADLSDVTLAVGEACNNAAEHGHVARGAFSVKCSYTDGEIVIEVADRGMGFDPHGKGETSDPNMMKLRGLGIFVMHSLMDDVYFSSHPSGTSVRLTKRVGHGLGPQADGRGAGGRDGQPQLRSMGERLKALLELRGVHSGSRRER